ncbi:MAG: retroviral-like aspartic protease family protein [Rhizobiales bacterium]|nr:retroviral-like aspartic protease family protein [Hyphomicrobiales bacterium]
MPCLSGSFDPRDGIYYTVTILPVPVPGAVGNVISNQTLHGFKALFDTGAQCTCVSQRVAEKVGLSPRGRGNLISASEVKETNIYLFNVGFVMSSTQDAQGKVSGHLQIFGPLQGLEIRAEDSDDVDVLIGMDVLGRGALHVGFDGRFLFSW